MDKEDKNYQLESYGSYSLATRNTVNQLKEALSWEAMCLQGMRQCREQTGWIPSRRAIHRQAKACRALQTELHVCQDDWGRLTRHLQSRPDSGETAS